MDFFTSLVSFQGGFLYEHAPQLVTFLTFGALSFTASFLTLFLPETMNKGLPDTVLQANDLVQGNRKRSSLVRGHHGASNDSVDEVGYGKSPEWVEVGTDQMLTEQWTNLNCIITANDSRSTG